MNGAEKASKYQEEARRQHTRLTLDHARIRLECASLAKGKRVAVLYAPSAEGHQELLRLATGEAGLTAVLFDATQFSSVDGFIAALPTVDAVVVLSDEAYSTSLLSDPQIVWIAEKRPDLHPIVVRIGETHESHRARFFLARGDAIQILDVDTWRIVPDFLMEAVARGSTRQK